jgi:hypothetical protein
VNKWERQGEMYMTGGYPSQPGEEEIHGLTLVAGRARRMGREGHRGQPRQRRGEGA